MMHDSIESVNHYNQFKAQLNQHKRYGKGYVAPESYSQSWLRNRLRKTGVSSRVSKNHRYQSKATQLAINNHSGHNASQHVSISDNNMHYTAQRKHKGLQQLRHAQQDYDNSAHNHNMFTCLSQSCKYKLRFVPCADLTTIPQHSSQLKAEHSHCDTKVSANNSELAAHGKTTIELTTLLYDFLSPASSRLQTAEDTQNIPKLNSAYANTTNSPSCSLLRCYPQKSLRLSTKLAILDQHRAFNSVHDLQNSMRYDSSAYTTQLSICRPALVALIQNSSQSSG
ncbi:5'-3' exoribonuclease 3-like [Dorcoceras hygrometricum]|uniref:5'-3' exoribonuclease 3-like n=1 Tax=Dorcoceras hygrometricum TaxID=472368 RepID=A0A2Z7C0T3_9LAMI|nr:5'-3' exoribonuclease 3-like [Dorcoceras hygrometricum]